MKKQIIIVKIVLILLLSNLHAYEPWTWVFTKNFPGSVRNSRRKELYFIKKDIPEFTQMIFSWNALRPQQGHFTFWGQVRDAKTQQWHEWHKMIDWGKEIQRSYFNSSHSGTKYCHVRLETPEKAFADAVRIRIQAHDGACVDDVKTITVNAVNLKNFTTEILKPLYQLPSIRISHIPKTSQMALDHPKAHVLCSPTSCSMLVGYLQKKTINPITFAESAYDNGLQAYGSWPFNTAHAFEQTQGKQLFRVMRLDSFHDLHKKLQEQIPVVVSVRGALKGAPKAYNQGHLLLVVGWDQATKKVLCHDPAHSNDEKVYSEYDLAAFCRAWECSRRLAYVAENNFRKI